MTSLDAFFDAAVPYFKGEGDDASLVHTLGPSPSATPRFAFYRRLMRANVHRVLRSMYASLASAVDEVEAGTFERWMDAFDRAHPPQGWDLNALAEPFSTFLENAAASSVANTADDDKGLQVPAWAAAVADWSYTRYALGRAVEAEHPALLVPVAVRSYAYDVVSFEREQHQHNHDACGHAHHAPEPKRATSAPAATPTTLLAWRDSAGGVRFQRAAATHLVALAAACGQAAPETIAAIGSDALDAAVANLVTAGILAPPADAPSTDAPSTDAKRVDELRVDETRVDDKQATL